MERPEIRYAWNADAALSYEVLGEGAADLLYLQGYLSNLELNREHPALARFVRELARSTRLVMSDRRGLGCSERFTAADTPPIETMMEDLVAVMDAASVPRPILFATGDCGFIATLFAATYVDRVAALILYGAVPSYHRSAKAPWGLAGDDFEEVMKAARAVWGDGSWARETNPSLDHDEHARWWAARYERLSLAPGSVYGEVMRFAQSDVSGVLPSIHVPTLVLHRPDAWPHVTGGRYLAANIPGARLVELPGSDHLPWLGDQDAVLREVRRFLAALREEDAALDRVLATVVFTDIVGSTENAARLGDRTWRELLAAHDSTIRALLARYRGSEINTTGDGFLASFDGPARAVHCASAIAQAVRPLGLEIRAGVHTGEVELVDGALRGIAVHIGARISAMASPSEVLVSQTVKDLVAGSGIAFEDRGLYELKGVPETWRVYAVLAA